MGEEEEGSLFSDTIAIALSIGCYYIEKWERWRETY